MEIKDIIKWWKFPKATIINRNLPKTQIFPHIKNAKDKQFLIDSVQSIYMLANFKTDNTQIPNYKSDDELYTEIWFYYVKTKKSGESEKIFKILTGLIPYPLVILTDEADGFTLYTGKFKRLTNDYLKLENIYPSPIFKYEEANSILDKLTIEEIQHQNFKVFYDGVRDELTRNLAIEQYGEVAQDITAATKDQLDKLNKSIETLRSQIKHEKQLNRKIDMQMQMRQLKNELQSILDQ